MSNWRRQSAKRILYLGAAALFMAAGQPVSYAQTGSAITFQDILQEPDNTALNMAYARQKADEGDILSALAAIERILFSEPEYDEARSFYVDLLLRADDQQAARRELMALEVRALSPELTRTVNAYRARAGMNALASSKRAKAEDTVRGLVAFGLRYDDNAGNALFDVNLPAAASNDDFAGFVQGALMLKSAPTDSGIYVRAGINGQMVRYFDFSAIDNDTYGANVGVSGGSAAIQWHLDGRVRQVQIDNTAYLTQYGPVLRLVSQVSPQTRLHASAAYYEQDFDDIPNSFGEDGRSGDQIIGQIGVEQKLDPKTTFALFANYTDKSADAAILGYDGLGARAVLSRYFDNEGYAKASGSFQSLNYGGGSGRKDDRWKLQGTLGAPLSALAPSLGGDLDNLSLEGSVRYIDRSSNGGILDFSSFGAETRLIWNF